MSETDEREALLAPCPFCGGVAALSKHPKGYYLAHCADGTCDPGHLTFAVPEKWNRRNSPRIPAAGTPEEAEAVERARQALAVDGGPPVSDEGWAVRAQRRSILTVIRALRGDDQ